MADPPLERRTTTPIAPGLLRPRLMSAPHGVVNPRLRLAVGPTGTGKTTLLMQWASQCPGDVVWFQSGRPDVRSGELFSFLACALGAATDREPASSFPGLASAAELLDRHFYFVVDDFHLLAGTSFEEELEQLIAINSPHMHFLVGSRHFPRINMAKSELRNAFSVFGDDLRFRDYEIEQLFRTAFKRPLSVHGVSNIARVTDGWAAALYLFHLATTNRSNVERRRAAESLNSRSRFAADYLVNHFLAGTTPEMSRLLTVASLLDFITPSRCDALLDRHDSRAMLHNLEELGVIFTEDIGATYQMPKVLLLYLRAGIDEMEPEEQAGLRQRTAVLLEQEGEVGEGLRILAEGGDWESVKLLLARAGGLAIQPGRCGWAASIPDHVMPDDAWIVAAGSREMLDDGRTAAAEGAAARVGELTADPECLRIANGLRLTAAVWSVGGKPEGADNPLGNFRKAISGDPRSTTCSPSIQEDPENLFTGLSFLLAGDQRSALPMLIQCAERLDLDPSAALAAQLALAVFGHESARSDSWATAAEVDSVQRQAERRGFTWLARLAGGIQAALSGTPAAFAAMTSAIRTCEDRGDEWGAALISAVAALLRLWTGASDPEQLEALAKRFRRLSAGTLEAWTYSAEALVSANLDLPCALENAQSAEAFARTAAVPGALAVAYAAMALQKPGEYGELMHQAAETAQFAGLVCRPWTWLAQCRHELVLPPAVPVGIEPPIRHGDVNTEPVVERARLPSLQITCLGGFTLSREMVPVDLSRIRPQARTVLRILCLNAGRLVHRERLAGILWPDLDAPAALHALQVSVSCLRGALQPEGLAVGGQLLVRQGAAYALVLGTESTFDLKDFDHSLHAASLAKSAGDTLGTAADLRRAVGLYVGEVLPEDGPAEWVSDIRERYRQRAAEAAATLASVELSLGNAAAAAAAATRSVEIDPWRDESWRTLVETFRRLGNPAAAQRAQRRYDLVLSSLGVMAEYGPHMAGSVISAPKTVPPRRLPGLPPDPSNPES